MRWKECSGCFSLTLIHSFKSVVFCLCESVEQGIAVRGGWRQCKDAGKKRQAAFEKKKRKSLVDPDAWTKHMSLDSGMIVPKQNYRRGSESKQKRKRSPGSDI